MLPQKTHEVLLKDASTEIESIESDPSSDIRLLPEQSERVETGPLQFGSDWPGVFIRGDNAGAMALSLKFLLDGCREPILIAELRGLQHLLESAKTTPHIG